MTTILHDEIPIPTSPNLISVFLTFLTNGFLGAYVEDEELDASLLRLRSSCKSLNLGIMSRGPKRFTNRL